MELAHRIVASRRDERCGCGSLVAKISPEGVEILCRRCKRIHRIPWLGRDVRGAAIGRSGVKR